MASITLKHIYKVYPRSKAERKKEKIESISPFAVRDFNLEIKDGEFIVLVGPSGCGKSTTLRMIAGLEDISGGELYIDNVLSNNIDASKRNIAMVFQNYALYPHMTSYQNMSYALKLRRTPKEEIDRRVKEAAEILDITHLLTRKPAEMSGGQRQRVALGRALVRDPKVFLLDEPLSNLDAKLRASMRNEIVKLHERVQTTFVYVTHDQVEAMTMGDRIVVMKDGVIQQCGTPSEIYDSPVNMFVAGFIGTPQMNFFDVDFTAQPDKVLISLPNGSIIDYPFKDFKPIVDDYTKGDKKQLVLGVRSEHISIVTKGIGAIVTFVEILGNTTNIICKLENSEVEFCLSVQERSTIKAGDKISVAFKANNLHLFNKETSTTIYKQAQEEKKENE